MKTTQLFTVALLCLSSNAFCVQPAPTYFMRFPFHPTQDGLTSAQHKTVDSIYAALAPGESIKITVLSPEEEKLNQVQRAQLSYKRTDSFLHFCSQNNIPTNEYYALVVPFTLPNTVRTQDLTHNFYNSFMYNKSQSHFIFTRTQVKATNIAASKFDATHEKEMQKFSMNPEQPMEAKLVSGTKITIPASSLMFADGREPKGAVEIQVSEYKDMDAIIFKAMTTTCGSKKLQTAGMWHIAVVSEGQPLVMKPGKHYDIVVGMNDQQKNMKVFTGKMKGGMLDWVEQKDDKVIFTASLSDAPIPVKETTQEIKKENELNVVSEEVVWNDNRNLNVNTKGGFGVFENKEYMQRDSIKSYDLQLNDFGWINCDAFDETQKLTDVFVSGDIPKDATVMMVYTKRKSVLPGYLCDDGKSVKFGNVAEDETAMLIVFKRNEDKKTVTKFTKMVNPGNEKTVRVKTEEVSLEALQAELKRTVGDI